MTEPSGDVLVLGLIIVGEGVIVIPKTLNLIEKQKQGYEMPDPFCPLLDFHRLLCCLSEDLMN